MSEGEDYYKNKFQFFHDIKPINKAPLRENLYKASYNLSSAYEFLQVLEEIDTVKESRHNASAVTLVFFMATNSLMVSIRKLIDGNSEVNFRSLIKIMNMYYKKSDNDIELEKIKLIYSKYNTFIDKGITHQDSGDITAPEKMKLPNYPEIRADLDYLKSLYEKYVGKVCKQSIKIKFIHNSAVKNLIGRLND